MKLLHWIACHVFRLHTWRADLSDVHKSEWPTPYDSPEQRARTLSGKPKICLHCDATGVID